VKKSVQAYIGCVSGAVMKDEYVQLITNAGFQDVRIIEETRFPVDVIDDPSVKAIAKESGISLAKTKEFSNSVASIKVSGTKPK
jgi:hypothetical protein